MSEERHFLQRPKWDWHSPPPLATSRRSERQAWRKAPRMRRRLGEQLIIVMRVRTNSFETADFHHRKRSREHWSPPAPEAVAWGPPRAKDCDPLCQEASCRLPLARQLQQWRRLRTANILGVGTSKLR